MAAPFVAGGLFTEAPRVDAVVSAVMPASLPVLSEPLIPAPSVPAPRRVRTTRPRPRLESRTVTVANIGMVVGTSGRLEAPTKRDGGLKGFGRKLAGLFIGNRSASARPFPTLPE